MNFFRGHDIGPGMDDNQVRQLCYDMKSGMVIDRHESMILANLLEELFEELWQEQEQNVALKRELKDWIDKD